jgi:hypothetical protein
MSTSRPNKPNALKRLLQMLAAACAWPRTSKQPSTNPAVPQAAPPQADETEICHPRQDGGVSLAVQSQPRTLTSLRAATFLLPLALALLLAGAGCSRRSYFVSLQDQEAIALGSDVLLDGKKVGTVTGITQKADAPGRAAQFVVTTVGVELKVGTEREQAGGMRLSSASCPENAAVLPSGSTLPTRAPVINFTRSTIQGARDRLFEFYALHPAMAIALPILAAGMLLCLLRASFRRKACLILPLCLLPLGAKSTAADLGFTRQALIAEEQQYEDRLQKARAEVAAAKDRNAAGLAGLAEAPVVTGLMILDRLQVEMAGHQDRISALRRASLAYNREKEIIRLSRNDAVRFGIRDKSPLGACRRRWPRHTR